jgi:hypothetical protein
VACSGDSLLLLYCDGLSKMVTNGDQQKATAWIGREPAGRGKCFFVKSNPFKSWNSTYTSRGSASAEGCENKTKNNI